MCSGEKARGNNVVSPPTATHVLAFQRQKKFECQKWSFYGETWCACEDLANNLICDGKRQTFYKSLSWHSQQICRLCCVHSICFVLLTTFVEVLFCQILKKIVFWKTNNVGEQLVVVLLSNIKMIIVLVLFVLYFSFSRFHWYILYCYNVVVDLVRNVL